MRLLVTIVGSIIALPIAAALYVMSRTARDPRNAVFAEGRVPDPFPHGVHHGTVPGYERLAQVWRGKRFDAAEATGINLVGVGARMKEAFPFEMYVAPRLDGEKGEVLRIDYDIPRNPFWLRWVVDELVEIGSGQYLGKAWLRMIPGFPFGVVFFELRAQHDG